MVKYSFVVFALTWVVDLLLILGTNRLTGYPPGLWRAAPAALLSGVYGSICLIPAISFLENWYWLTIVLGIFFVIAFGLNRSALRRGGVWLLLKFALFGAATVFDTGSFGAAMAAVGALGLIYAWGMPVTEPGEKLIPVELRYGDRRWRLTALYDTGNTLRDPITGERVLVAGADMGNTLLGLTAGQLASPVETLASGLAPGMRLIPYRTVGQQGAMMLAMRLRDVQVGSWRGNALVAFAPESFGKQDGYQMLVGGSMG